MTESGRVEIWDGHILDTHTDENGELWFRARLEAEGQPLYEAKMPASKMVAPEQMEMIQVAAQFTLTVSEVIPSVDSVETSNETPAARVEAHLEFKPWPEVTREEMQAALKQARARRGEAQ